MSNAKKTKTVKWGEEPKLGVLDALYLPAIASGVATAIRHAVTGKATTRQYPEVEPEIPPNYRGVHRLNRDEEGRVKCVACYMCQTACPANCIEIIAAPAPKDDPHWKDRDKYPATFTIDELRCIYCGMCEEACPVDAIELTSIYDLTGLSREEMIFDREKLLSVFDETVKTGKDPVRTHRGVLGPASETASTAKQSPPPPGRGRRG
ncbi:MAG: NuoI/complex I 23 kDa subunit family protein [Planctomycetota bacterium]|jgi:NADH-quinone oxidoreductase subunit I